MAAMKAFLSGIALWRSNKTLLSRQRSASIQQSARKLLKKFTLGKGSKLMVRAFDNERISRRMIKYSPLEKKTTEDTMSQIKIRCLAATYFLDH